jgi:hypothetical protein
MRVALAIVAVFLVVGLLGYFGGPFQRLRVSEEDACKKQCDKVNKFSRLVSPYSPGTVSPGKYDGPWKCECY